jgi:hypothetical protein
MNGCPTAIDPTCTVADTCGPCKPGWQHQNGFLIIPSCQQPTDFGLIALCISLFLCLPCMIFFINRLRILYQYIKFGETNKRLELASSMIIINICIIGMMASLFSGSAPLTQLFGNGYIGTSLYFMYLLKVRLVHPAFSMRSKTRAQMENIDYKLIVTSEAVCFCLTVALLIFGFNGDVEAFNITAVINLLLSAFMGLLSLFEIIWFARLIKRLGGSSSDEVMNGGDISPSKKISYQNAMKRVEQIAKTATIIIVVVFPSTSWGLIYIKFGTVPYMEVIICIVVLGAPIWNYMMVKDLTSIANVNNQATNSNIRKNNVRSITVTSGGNNNNNNGDVDSSRRNDE